MSNRFNELLQPQGYVSTYVPLPLDMIAKAGAMKQGQFDEDTARIGETADMIKINADPHREGFRDKLLQSYNNEIADLADQYTKTGDNSLMYKVNDLKRRFANDTTRLGLEKSHDNWLKQQKDSQEYSKTSKYSDIYDSYKTDNPYDENGQFKTFDYNGMLTKEDYHSKADTIMSGIAKDGSAWDGYKVNPKTGLPDIGQFGEYWKTNSKGTGVRLPKIMQIAKDNADVFLRTDEGRFYIDELIGSPVNYKDLSPEQKDILKKHATDYLLHVGSKQAGWESASGNNLSFLDKDQLGRVNPVAPERSGTVSPSNTIANNLKIGEFNVKDFITADGKVDWVKMTKGSVNYKEVFGKVFTDYAKVKTKNVDESFVNNINTIAGANGWDVDNFGKKLKPHEMVERTLIAMQNMNVSSGAIYQPTTEASKAFGAKIWNQFDKSKMKDADKKSFNDNHEDKDATTFQGFDYSDKDNPRVRLQTFRAGKFITNSYTIDNTDIVSKLKPISVMINNSQEKMIHPEKRTVSDIREASNNLTAALGIIPNIRSIMQITSIGDLYPLGKEMLADGSTVFTYSDKNNPGSVKALRVTPDGVGHPASSLNDIVIDETNSFFNSSQGIESADKQEKNVTYSTGK